MPLTFTFKIWSNGRSFLIAFRKVSARWNISFSISLLNISTVSIWCPIRLLLAWTVGTDATAEVRRFELLSLLYLVTLLIGNGETVLWEGNILECSLVSLSSTKCTLDLCDASCRGCVNDSNNNNNMEKLIYSIALYFIVYKLFDFYNGKKCNAKSNIRIAFGFLFI